MAMIKLDHVTKRYPAATSDAVERLDLEIEDGEFFGLLGPSGSGKTTVLRMIAGLEHPTAGAISFDGTDVMGQSPQKRNIAMIFEQNALYPHMTARQNISYPLKIRKTSKQELQRSVQKMAEMLNIDHLLDRRPSQMSGGQQQRVAVARALVRTPAVCCMDEPIAHLDAALRGRLRGELRHMQQLLGVTSVIVTHDPIEAMTMTDRVAVMNDGQIQQVGKPREIHSYPCNAFVAQFFGLYTMNQIQGHLAQDSTGHVAGVEISVPTRIREALGRNNHEFKLGIRPEALEVRPASSPAHCTDEFIELPGHVYVSETLGEGNLVRVQVGEEIVRVITKVPVEFDIKRPVVLRIPVARSFVFAGEGDRTLAFPAEDATPVVTV